MSEPYPKYLMDKGPKQLREWAEENLRMAEGENHDRNLSRWAKELIELADKLEH